MSWGRRWSPSQGYFSPSSINIIALDYLLDYDKVLKIIINKWFKLIMMETFVLMCSLVARSSTVAHHLGSFGSGFESFQIRKKGLSFLQLSQMNKSYRFQPWLIVKVLEWKALSMLEMTLKQKKKIKTCFARKIYSRYFFSYFWQVLIEWLVIKAPLSLLEALASRYFSYSLDC